MFRKFAIGPILKVSFSSWLPRPPVMTSLLFCFWFSGALPPLLLDNYPLFVSFFFPTSLTIIGNFFLPFLWFAAA